jgi:hypothetical protein
LSNFIKKPHSYADLQNARFNTNASIFLSAKERFEEYCKNVPGSWDSISKVIEELKIRLFHETWDSISNSLSEAQLCKLSEIKIDDTMNRPLNWTHLIKILDNFSPTRAMPICVYRDKVASDYLTAWEGQHTTIVLYIISVLIYGLDPKDVAIPIIISKSSNKEDIRINFIGQASDDKKALSPLDLHKQKIHGVLTDKSTNPDWILDTEKYKLYSSVGMFLTAKAYGDADLPGAVTHVDSIIKSKLSTLKTFCNYWSHRKVYEDRRVETKEIIHMNHLFVLAEDQDIVWNDSDIKAIVDIFWKAFKCEFTGTPYINIFWKQLANSYDRWYATTYPSNLAYVPKKLTLTERGDPQVTYGLTFMIEQLRFSGFKGQLPNYKHPDGYFTDPRDLWQITI